MAARNEAADDSSGQEKDKQSFYTSSPRTSQSLLGAIKKYQEDGVHLFPLNGNKIPIVEEWNDKHFGISAFDKAKGLGSCPGLWKDSVMVFDADGPNGLKSWEILLDKYGPLPPTFSVVTGREEGGRHHYYRTPAELYVKSTASKIAHKIDIRGTRGQAVLPPTIHKSGKQYQWQYNGEPVAFVDPSMIPQLTNSWVQALIDADCAYYPEKNRRKAEPKSTSNSSAYGLKALEEETERVSSAPEGQRNDVLNRSAFALGALVGIGKLSRTLVEQALLDAAVGAGLPEREAIKTIESGLRAGECEPRQSVGKDTPGGSGNGAAEQRPDENPEAKKAWTHARKLMPRTSYPWGVLPPEISKSLRKLARSCASTATPLPGFACAMIGAAVGRTVGISVKASWTEPLIFWSFDLLDSGEGKTAKMRNLAHVIMQAQREKQDEYNRKYEEWAALPKKERGDPPVRPRGYYFTSLTVEGVHAESEGHPTGGMIALLNEASSFIGGQNEYKGGRGTDREAWLSLHDGTDARIVRATKSTLITGARIQIIGGIQPKVFRRVFGGDDGLYLYDGTIYRGLYTYSPPQHHPLTLEAWSEEHREPWDRTLKMALEWADQQDAPHIIYLNSEAQDLFLTWRNNLDCEKAFLPPELRGFLPKAYGYSLRLAAAIDLMHQFYDGQSPRRLLDAEGMQRGIDAVMFYLGQAVDAMQLILGDALTADPIKTRIIDALRDRGTMTATEIYVDVFHRNRSSGEIREALNELDKTGEVERISEPTSGRPVTIYKIAPASKRSKRSKSPGTDNLNDLFDLNEQNEKKSHATRMSGLNDLNEPISDFENNIDEVEI